MKTIEQVSNLDDILLKKLNAYGQYLENKLIYMKLDQVIEKIKSFDEVQFIILYGSASEDRMTEESDVDLCVGYDGNEEEASRFRYDILSELFDDDYDVQIFQQLPLYVKKEVLKGEVLYCRDKQELYDIAYRSIREFDDFKHRYYDYIGKEAII